LQWDVYGALGVALRKLPGSAYIDYLGLAIQVFREIGPAKHIGEKR